MTIHRRLVNVAIGIGAVAVVLAIILPPWGPRKNPSRQLITHAQMQSITNALEVYQRYDGAYPPSVDPGGGSRVFVRYLVGDRLINGDSPVDERGNPFEPFFHSPEDYEMNGDRPVAILDRFGNPILYYLAAPRRDDDDPNRPLWGPRGVFDSDHNAHVPLISDQDLTDANAADSAFILVSAGLDAIWGTDDDSLMAGGRRPVAEPAEEGAAP